MRRVVFATSTPSAVESAHLCEHEKVNEIGEDFDRDGRLLRLVRCKRCGLLMRIYVPQL